MRSVIADLAPNFYDYALLSKVVALRLADPTMSLRAIARATGTTHPHVKKLLELFDADPVGVRAELQAAGFLI